MTRTGSIFNPISRSWKFGKWIVPVVTAAAVIGGSASFVPPAMAQGTMQQKVEPTQARIQLENFEKRVAAGEADQVISECTKLIEADPKNAFIAYVGRGIALNAKKNYDAAIKDFNEALDITGREQEKLDIRGFAYTHKSDSQYHKGNFIAAVDNAYYALQELPQHAPAHARRARAYIGWEKADKAITSANRALAIEPKMAEAISIRGMAYGLQKKYDDCIKAQTEALAIEPNSAVFLERRALAYLAKNDPAKASKDLADALRLDPENTEALCDRAMLHAMTGKIGDALADLDTAIKTNPSSFRAHFQKAMTLHFQKRYDESLTAANEALRLNPQFTRGLVFRGNLHNDRKDYEAAVEDFTAALEQDPNSVDAYNGRANAYRRLGKNELARLDSAKARELQPAQASKGKSDDKDKKEKETPPPVFKVTSRGVDPKRRPQVMEAARKIDEFVEKNYAKYNVKPNPMTDDYQFVRRIYLDITGTIPTYQQTLKFINSKDPDKRANLIDELLASDGYASHAFNYWADILRYVDRISEDVRGEPYRQWIKQSLAENKPWDQFVYELLTAEGLIWENPATGYLQRDANMPLDNMNNTVRIFLGTQIGCAQCHDHPFDRWTQKEFYQMAAFTFGTTTRAGGGDKRFWESNPSERLRDEYNEIVQEEEDRRNNYYVFEQLLRVNMRIVNDQPGRKLQLPKDYAYENGKPGQVVEPQTLFGSKANIKPGETPRQAFARWLTEKENPRFAKTIANRLWQRAFGYGQIEPVDDMTDHTEAENPELMAFLEQTMKDLDFNMKEYQRILFNTKTYQRQACFDEVPFGAPYHFPGPMLRRMTAEQVWDSILTLALPNPDEYREIQYQLRTDVTGYDLSKVSAQELLSSRRKQAAIDDMQRKWQDKFRYKGTLLARASELPAPLPPNHFIRMFGQSDRELIAASSTNGSVPQVLFMFNGPISHMMLEKDSAMYNNVMKKKTVTEGVKTVFLTVLNREPDAEDMALATQEIRANGPAGYGNVIWSLVNTREFLFIQ